MADISSTDRADFGNPSRVDRLMARTASITHDILDIQIDKAQARKYAIKFSILYAITGLFWYIVSSYMAVAMAPF